MGKAKTLRLDPIEARAANEFMRRHHYSGKVVRNSQLHVGVFLDGHLGGVMQFGPPMDKRKIQGLVRGTKWHEFMELNRMAFADRLPRNSESRALGICMRLLRRNVPQLKWLVSFADATRCGDGTIYRAAGFVLTGIKANKNLARMPTGEVIHKLTFQSSPLQKHAFLGGRSYADVMGGAMSWGGFCDKVGATILVGHQLRYVYFLDTAYRERLTVAEIPFSRIAEVGASMYRGKKPASVV